MIRYVAQAIEVNPIDESSCSWQCPFYSANKHRPICWLGRGHQYITHGKRTPYCLSLEEALRNDK